MDWIYLFTSLNGRISRQTFWIGFAFLAAAERQIPRWLTSSKASACAPSRTSPSPIWNSHWPPSAPMTAICRPG